MGDDREAKVRWRRRRDFRPSEIAEAALVEFAQRGYAAARMTDIAARAGLSKAALYVYFPTKAELFHAVLSEHAAPKLDALKVIAAAPPSFAAALDAVLGAMTGVVQRPELRRLARMVIAESGNFPELAALWHEKVVGPAIETVSAIIARAQSGGEVRSGDSRLMAFSIVGPLLLSVIWREVIEPAGGEPLDLALLAQEHRAVLQLGLMRSPEDLKTHREARSRSRSAEV